MLHGRKLYATVMLVYDVTGDCHSKSSAVTYRFALGLMRISVI